MSRFFAIGLCLLTAFLLGSQPVASQESEAGETLCIPMGSFTLNPPQGVEPKRSPVEFPHSIHFDFNCKICHHTWDGNSQVQNCTTSDCHALTQAPEQPLEGGVFTAEAIQYYKYAYHTQCIGCHKEIKRMNLKAESEAGINAAELQPTGPSGCIGCHPK